MTPITSTRRRVAAGKPTCSAQLVVYADSTSAADAFSHLQRFAVFHVSNPVYGAECLATGCAVHQSFLARYAAVSATRNSVPENRTPVNAHTPPKQAELCPSKPKR